MAVPLPPTKRRARRVLALLAKAYPDAACALRFETPLQLLVATILSAQCTDARVNEVTPALFRRYRTAAATAEARPAELERLVRSTGFYKNKARSIQGCCREIQERHGGKVPVGMEELTALPGVGRKTANLVRAYAFGKPGIICDTHVLRVTGRLGLTTNTDPERVEADLARFLPERDWTAFSTVIMTHGRRCCTARNPNCPGCPVLPLCPEGLRITGGHGARSRG